MAQKLLQFTSFAYYFCLRCKTHDFAIFAFVLSITHISNYMIFVRKLFVRKCFYQKIITRLLHINPMLYIRLLISVFNVFSMFQSWDSIWLSDIYSVQCVDWKKVLHFYVNERWEARRKQIKSQLRMIIYKDAQYFHF